MKHTLLSAVFAAAEQGFGLGLILVWVGTARALERLRAEGAWLVVDGRAVEVLGGQAKVGGTKYLILSHRQSADELADAFGEGDVLIVEPAAKAKFPLGSRELCHRLTESRRGARAAEWDGFENH